MRPDLSISRLHEKLQTQASAAYDYLKQPAKPRDVDTLTHAPGQSRPLATRLSHAASQVATAVWADNTSAWASVSRGYMSARKFLPTYALDSSLACALLAGQLSVSLMGPALGLRKGVDAVTGGKANGGLPTVAARALLLSLVLSQVLVFREAELAGMAAGAVVHMAARALPNMVGVQKPAEWAALGATLAASQAVFEAVDMARRSIVPAPQFVVTNTTCNGMDEICDKQVCDVAFPSAHNAMSTPQLFNDVPAPFNVLDKAASNQLLSVEDQFKRGIRGFTLENFLDDKGALYTSHNTVWRIEPFSQTLARFTKLLDENPREIIMIQAMAQGQYDGAKMQAALYQAINDSGLSKYLVNNNCTSEQESPAHGGVACDTRVGSLIDAGVRAVLVTGGFVETTFEAVRLQEFNSFRGLFGWGSDARPSPMILNLFSTLADWRTSDSINPLIPDLVRVFLAETYQRPTMLVASHVETSPIIDIAIELNKQPSPLGRNVSCDSAL